MPQTADGSTPNKRRRALKERIRVTRACDACKKKKLRCSGTIPCTLCLQSRETCQYNSGYRRGRQPEIPTLGLQDCTHPIHSENIPIERGNRGTVSVANLHSPESRPPPELSERAVASAGVSLTGNCIPIDNTEGAYVRASCRNSLEPEPTDLEGHYVGPSSGVSFLLRVQRRLHEHVNVSDNSLIFSFGDAPLPKTDQHVLILPSLGTAKRLVDRYFNFAFPTHRFLHRETVERWLEEFYRPNESKQNSSVKALLLMVFAHGRQYLLEESYDDLDQVNSTAYFAASENYLATETGRVQLTSVQARLAQCFYLLYQDRINHCWSLFGITARLAQAIALHRRRRWKNPPDLIENECRKRVFWSTYSLDNYLSAALGRPKIFQDEDIDQELPACVNDEQITHDKILPASTNVQSIMLASLYHSKLCKIISGILKELYGVRQKTLELQASIAQRYELDLMRWKNDMSSFLDVPNTDLLQVTYQRQCTVLNLAFLHAKILLFRPFILRNMASLGKTKSAVPDSEILQNQLRANADKCLDAALKIVSIFKELCKSKRMHRVFWFTQYFVFCAIVVLYVYVIQGRFEASEDGEEYLRSGEQAQIELYKYGASLSFGRRYALILEELLNEGRKFIRHRHQNLRTRITLTSHPHEDVPLATVAPGHRPTVGLASFTPRIPLETTNLSSNDFGDGWVSPVEFPQAEHESGTGSWMENTVYADHLPLEMENFTNWVGFDSLALTGFGDLGLMHPV